MHSNRSSGFSLTKFLIIFVIILVVISGGLTATYFILKQQQTASAQLFMGNFLGEIEKNDSQTSFASFSDSLKGSADTQQNNYLTWLFWIQPFNAATDKVTITEPVDSVSYANDSIGNILGTKETITFIYKTSNGRKISFDVLKSGNAWLVNNYATL